MDVVVLARFSLNPVSIDDQRRTGAEGHLTMRKSHILDVQHSPYTQATSPLSPTKLDMHTYGTYMA